VSLTKHKLDMTISLQVNVNDLPDSLWGNTNTC